MYVYVVSFVLSGSVRFMGHVVYVVFCQIILMLYSNLLTVLNVLHKYNLLGCIR